MESTVETPIASASKPPVLKLRVPVIVVLAQRKMPIAAIRRLSAGYIVQFDKPVNEKLELMVNNRVIARGDAVKVGENFGLHVTRIHSKSRTASLSTP